MSVGFPKDRHFSTTQLINRLVRIHKDRNKEMKKQFHVFVKKLSQTNMNWSAMHLPLSLTNKRSYMKQYPIHSPRQETKRHRLTHVLTHSHLFCFNKLCVKNQWDIHINGVLTNLCSNKRWVLTKKKHGFSQIMILTNLSQLSHVCSHKKVSSQKKTHVQTKLTKHTIHSTVRNINIVINVELYLFGVILNI